MKQTPNKFYIYAYLDPRKPGDYKYGSVKLSYEPFYVGKGTRKRHLAHLLPYYMKKNFNPHLNNKIRKIRRETGTDPIILKLFEGDEKTAFQKEIQLIKKIGRKIHHGPLTNIYEGGEGSSKSEETKQKISATKKSQHIASGKRGNRYGTKHTAATRVKMSKKRSHGLSKEQKKNLSKIHCQNKPEHTKHWLVTSPDGVETTVFGLGQFCRENNLDQPHMFEVAKGKRSHHKKWKCRLL